MTEETKKGMGLTGVLLRLLAVVLVLVLLAAAVIFSMYRDFQSSEIAVPEEGIIYEVRPGTSMRKLAYDMQQRGMIDRPHFLILLGRELGAAHRLKTGEFVLTPGMTPRTLLERLVEGRVIQYSLTLVEGQTFRELMARIADHPMIENTLQGLDDAGVMARIGHPGEHPEGRFLPDTYNFPRNTTDVAFLQRAFDAMEKRLQTEWENREEGLPFKNAYEALILASIVEKETGVVEERPVIAGVFVRRLHKGMKLQTDPTVIYGMGAAYKGNIRRRDLRTDTPYNTYTRYGLPPTPIAMPGADAIHSVMHPAEGNSLYFVATGGGRHYFSSTLKEHSRAVDKFQRGKTHIRLKDPDQLR